LLVGADGRKGGVVESKRVLEPTSRSNEREGTRWRRQTRYEEDKDKATKPSQTFMMRFLYRLPVKRR
jgi:hypothetical protein